MKIVKKEKKLITLGKGCCERAVNLHWYGFIDDVMRDSQEQLNSFACMTNEKKKKKKERNSWRTHQKLTALQSWLL